MVPSATSRPWRIATAAALTLGLAACTGGDTAPETPTVGKPIERAVYRPADPQEALQQINAYRAANGLGALTLDPALGRIAADYAQHLADAGQMTHSLAPYGPLETRLNTAGYRFHTAAENLGQGYYTLDQAMAGWKGSPPHDHALRSPDKTRMGIASAINPAKRGEIYWCLLLASPRVDGGLPVLGGVPRRRGLIILPIPIIIPLP